MKNHRVNWHEAAVCAMQIELRDYSQFLTFYPEYVLGKNNYRIDLLIIHKLPNVSIPKNIARIFNTYNIFEIKGIGSSITTDSYYKTNGYAGLLIDSCGKRNQYARQNISLSFLCTRYPRNLFRHLTKDCKLVLEKFSPGIYYIHNEMYQTQVLVTSELPPEENLYLRCMCNNISDTLMANRLAHDYKAHSDQEIYVKYMEQITNANNYTKGVSPMICEGILNLCGTSSKEIEERAIQATKEADAKIYIPQINKLTEENDYLKKLLLANGIDF